MYDYLLASEARVDAVPAHNASANNSQQRQLGSLIASNSTAQTSRVLFLYSSPISPSSNRGGVGDRKDNWYWWALQAAAAVLVYTWTV